MHWTETIDIEAPIGEVVEAMRVKDLEKLKDYVERCSVRHCAPSR